MKARHAVTAGLLALSLTACVHAPGGRITEDDPRWDCHTMGNRICGQVQTAQEHCENVWVESGPTKAPEVLGSDCEEGTR